MVVPHINFLSKRRKKLSKQQRQDKQYWQYARYALLAVACLALSVVAGRFGMENFVLENVEEDIAAVESRILSQRDIQRSFLVLVEKVEALGEIIEDRSNKQEAIEFFSELFGTEVLIKQILYNPDSQVLELIIESQSVFVLEDTLLLLASERVTSEYSDISQSDLKRASNGSYELSLRINLNTETAQPEEEL